MGPLVLMLGMLLLLGMLSALETYGPAELQRLVREFAASGPDALREVDPPAELQRLVRECHGPPYRIMSGSPG